MRLKRLRRDGSLLNSADERIEHIASAEALSSIEAEGILVQVRLQMFGAEVVIDATNPVLR